VFAGLGSSLIVAIGFGVIVWANLQMSARLSPFSSTAEITSAIDTELVSGESHPTSRFTQRTRAWESGGCLEVDNSSDVESCSYGDRNSGKTIAVVGDSFAASWVPGIEDGFAREGWNVITLTKGACPAAELPAWTEPKRHDDVECKQHQSWALEELQRLQPEIIVVGNFSSLYIRNSVIGQEGEEPAAARWAAGLKSYVDSLQGITPNVVVLGEPPLPNCIIGSELQKCGRPQLLKGPSSSSEQIAMKSSEIAYIFCHCETR
jgi:hypothetical protein